MVITGLSWPECKKTRIRVIRQEPSCFQPSCLKEKSDACILPTTIGRLPEFTRQISYIFIDDIEEPPRERTPATVKECWRYHVVDRSEKGSEDVEYGFSKLERLLRNRVYLQPEVSYYFGKCLS